VSVRVPFYLTSTPPFPSESLLFPSLPSVLHSFLLHFFSFHVRTAMANPFDLNVHLEDDDDHNLPLDLNEPIVEGDTAYGNVLVHS
jgi:hypothetical protein